MVIPYYPTKLSLKVNRQPTKWRKEAVDAINEKYGKHKIYLGSSFEANHFSQHLGERGDTPERKAELFKGETKRKRVALPMFIVEVK